jgi:hypothetical protein
VNRDTSPEDTARYHDMLRAMSPAQRLERMTALTKAARQKVEAEIRQRHPQASEAEVRVRFTVRLHGRDAARRLFGDVPADAD